MASMRLMHPLMPFVTEAIWDQMPASWLDMNEDGAIERAEALMVASWPEPEAFERFIDEEAEPLLRARPRRRVRRPLHPRSLPPEPQGGFAVVVKAASAEVAEAIEGMADFICGLANISELSVRASEGFEKPAAAIALAGADFDAYVVVGDLVDFDAEKARLNKELATAEKELAAAERTLGNEGFTPRPQPEVVAKKRDAAAELTETTAAVKATPPT